MCRASFIATSWSRRNRRNVSFSETAEEMANHIANNIGIAGDALDSSVKRKIHKEALMYMNKGNCQLRDEIHVCVNPTLLHPITHRWHVHYMLSPYDGFLPFSREKELNVLVKSQILIRSCQNILKNIALSYRRRMESVKVFFYLEDALESCYTVEKHVKFVAIDCSNLADYVGLANLINACRLRLADHPEAVVLTETIIWKMSATTMLDYVEKALCCPLSMIPTIYGLRLVTHVQLGASRPPHLKNTLNQPYDIYWKIATPFTNVILYPSPVLTHCLEELTRKCYEMQHDLNSEEMDHQFLTPLTLHYIISSISQRARSDRWIYRDDCRLGNLKLPSVFYLSKRTIQSWEDGHPVLKLTADIRFNDYTSANLIEKLMASTLVGTPLLRLILIPYDILDDNEEFLNNINKINIAVPSGLIPDVHFIDNLQLEMKKTPDDEIESVSISFLLEADHGLEETHFGYIIDLRTWALKPPIFILQPINTLQVEKFQLPYPFAAKTDLVASTETSESELLVAGSCVETEDQYTVKIKIVCSGKNVSGKFVRIF